MSETKDGGTAFPVHGGRHPDDDPRNHTLGGGMTLRDWFAGQWVAAGHHANLYGSEAAEQAYGFADAMLAAREAING